MTRRSADHQWRDILSAPEGVFLLLADMAATEVRNMAYVDWIVNGKCCRDASRRPTHWTRIPHFPALDDAQERTA